MKRATLVLAALALLLGGVGQARAGFLYAIDDTTNSLYTIDPNTYAKTLIGSTGVPTGNFGDLTYDSANGNLYWIAGRDNDNLYTIDKTTGAATLVGSYGISDLFALAYDSTNGQLYAQATSGNVYTLDLATAAPTLIGSNGVYPGGYAYRADTDQLILLSAGGGAFYSIDTTTGAATLVNGGTGFVNDNGLTYDPELNAYFADDWSSMLYKWDGTTYIGGSVSGLGGDAFDGIAWVPTGASTAPEPSTLTLLGIGAVGLFGYGWRRRKLAVA